MMKLLMNDKKVIKNPIKNNVNDMQNGNKF